MSFAGINWEQDRPTDLEVDRMWRELSIRPLKIEPAESIHVFLEALKSVLVNGQVLFEQFEVDPHPVLAWFASRNRLEECGYPDAMLSAIESSGRLSELLAGRTAIGEIEDIDPIGLDVHLAQLLVWGGAYRNFRNRAPEAKKRIGIAAATELIGERFTTDETIVMRAVAQASESWSPWFLGVAWDSMLFIFDKQQSRLSILAGTDTD